MGGWTGENKRDDLFQDSECMHSRGYLMISTVVLSCSQVMLCQKVLVLIKSVREGYAISIFISRRWCVHP
jgi:hypothetical protein